MKYRFLPVLSLLVFLMSCAPSRKTISPNLSLKTLPSLPLSEIDIPVKIAAAPLLQKGEKLVPDEFTSDSWPNLIQPSCDFRYKYRFVRSALNISCENNVVGIRFSGTYQVAGSRCVCTAGIPVTPWISGSCGFGPESLRKVNIGLRSTLKFLPSYQLRTSTIITGVQAVDKCQVSVFSNDITKLVTDSIHSSLVSFTSALDQTIAGLDFSAMLQKVKDSGYRKIIMGKYGYIIINPAAIRVGQLNYIRDSFSISLGLSCHPQFSSDSNNAFPIKSSLPPLSQTDNRHGIRLYLDAAYGYDFLSKIMNDSLHNKVFDIKGRTIVVKEVRLRGIENNQLQLKIDFAGSNHGSVYLKGTPLLDTAKQTLMMPDINYSMEGEDFALSLARRLFKNKIRKTIQGKSYLDIAAFVKANTAVINSQLNKELGKGVFLSGRMQDIKIIGLLATENNLLLQFFIAADVSVLSNGSY